jgi:SAM-dependent methyltransferase
MNDYMEDDNLATPRDEMADTDWIKLWRDLAEKFRALPKQGEGGVADRWAKRAHSRGYNGDRRERDRDDPLMQFVLNRLLPDDTVLDIGAGIGRWSIPMARVCKRVTALDALPRMLEILLENSASENVTNIETVVGDWATADVERHDYVLSSHAAYISPDIVGYARKMERSATKACYLVMRVPRHDGVVGELSRRIRGTFHDSPNFIIGYNALLQAGIAGHVIMEERGRQWHNETLEDALARARRHLHLSTDEHDGMIMGLLRERLLLREGEYWWPDWMRSALVWWRPGTI